MEELNLILADENDILLVDNFDFLLKKVLDIETV